VPTLIRPKAKPKDKPTRTANFWGIRYRCPHRNRSWVISTFCNQKTNAERRLREFADLLERGEVGLENPFKQQRDDQRQRTRRLDVEECLRVFEQDLRQGRIRKRGKRTPVGGEHADTTMARLRKVLDGCRVRTVQCLTVERVNGYLDACVRDGTIRSAQTRKHYERAVKAFSKWCHATDRLPADPLDRLQVTYVDPDADVVHNRGEFTLEQVTAIMRAAVGGPTLTGLTGRQRALLYAFCSCTGFRAREAAAVRKRHFAPDYAFVSLSGEFTKNRRRANQPVPPGLREALAAYAAGLPDDAFLWPGGWEEKDGKWVPAGWVKARCAADFLRVDARKAGIVIGREGKAANGGKVLDFHSLRHTFISNLERAGVGDGMRQQLSRATGGIVQRYTHRELDQLAAESRRLRTPDLSVLGPPPPPTGHRG
jgi:integrase